MTVSISLKRSLALLVFLLGSVICDGVGANCPEPPAATTEAFVSLFVKDTLSQASAGLLLGPEHTVRREGDYWLLRSPDCVAVIVLPVRQSGARLPEAELRLPLASGLQLQDLESRFGPGETVFSSKTSSVLFRLPGFPEESIMVFARLYSGRVGSGSRVTTLVVRRVAGM